MSEELRSADQDVAEEPEIEAVRQQEAYRSGLHKEVRSWGYSMLIWGGLSVIASGIFDASWGILLIIIGIISFFVKDIAMLVIYAVTLAWAGIWNILTSYLSGSWAWGIFSLVQFYMAVRTFQVYLRFRRARTVLPTDSAKQDRIRSILPVSGCLMSAFAITGYAVLFLVAIILYASSAVNLPEGILNLSENLLINLAIFGFAACLGALLSGYRYKALSIIGILVSLLLILAWFVLLLLPSEPTGVLT